MILKGKKIVTVLRSPLALALALTLIGVAVLFVKTGGTALLLAVIALTVEALWAGAVLTSARARPNSKVIVAGSCCLLFFAFLLITAQKIPVSASSAAASRSDHGILMITEDDPLMHQALDALHTQGTRAALTVLRTASEQNPEVLAKGHSYVHTLGIAAYQTYGDVVKAFKSCDDTLLSGCYHGVLEGYLEAQPTVNSAVINTACSLGTDATPLEIFQCIHGLGHGLFMSTSGDLIHSLALCDELQDEYNRRHCGGGVFMASTDVFIAHLVSDQGKPTHEHPGGLPPGVDLKTDDLHYPCDAVPLRHQGECYHLHAGPVMLLSNFDGRVALRVCDEAPIASRNQCYVGVGRDVHGNQRNDAAALAVCSLGDPRFRGSCYAGVVGNLADRPDRMYPFCASITDPNDRRSCSTSLGQQIGALWPHQPDVYIARCGRLDEPYRDACVQAAQATGSR